MALDTTQYEECSHMKEIISTINTKMLAIQMVTSIRNILTNTMT